MATSSEAVDQEIDAITIDEWRESGQFLMHRDHRIFYLDQGHGEALLCVHGFPGCSWDWHLMWPALSQHFRCIAPDMMGFGFSDKPFEYPYSVADQADIIEELCEHLALDKVHLIAHGSGVAEVLEMLARRNEGHAADRCIASVILLNSSLLQEATETVTEGRLIMQFGESMVKTLTSDFLGNFLNTMRGPLTKLVGSEQKIYWKLMERGGGIRIVDKLMHYLSDRRENHARWLKALENPRVPVHAVIGEADPVWGEEIEEYLRRHVPNVGITALPEIGYYPHLEDPEGVIRACAEFVPGW